MIEVGDYVRTKTGRITKIIKIDKCIITVGHGMQEIKLYVKFSNSHVIYADNYEELYKEINEYIVKHSKNIIDLIEVGDYVNGMLIEDIEELDNKKIFYSNGEMSAWTNRDKGIETILTKEQYQANCYTVERK